MDSTVTQPTLLELAKQGKAQAIATLINRQLQPKGITAKAALKDGCLQIMLESAQVPNQQALVEFIRKGITSLEVESIVKAKIYGRQSEQLSLAWAEEIIFIEPSTPIPSETEVKKTKVTSTQPQNHTTPQQNIASSLPTKQKNWKGNNLAVISLLFTLWPLGLYWMFKYSNWSKRAKWSVVSAFAVVLLLPGFLHKSDTSAVNSLASGRSSVVDSKADSVAEISQESQDSATPEQKFTADYKRLVAQIEEPAISAALLNPSSHFPEDSVSTAKTVCHALTAGASWREIVEAQLSGIHTETDSPIIKQAVFQHLKITDRLATVHFCPDFAK